MQQKKTEDIFWNSLSDDFLEYELHRITKGELFERLLQPKEDWQLLLHNQELCGALVLNKIYNMKGDEIDVDDI